MGSDRRETALTVLAAALALVVHLFIAGAASTQATGSGGWPICSAAGATGLLPDGSRAPGAWLGDCCLSQCPLVAGGDRAATVVLHARQRDGVAIRRIGPRVRRDTRRERSPGRPRAPPRPG